MTPYTLEGTPETDITAWLLSDDSQGEIEEIDSIVSYLLLLDTGREVQE